MYRPMPTEPPQGDEMDETTPADAETPETPPDETDVEQAPETPADAVSLEETAGDALADAEATPEPEKAPLADPETLDPQELADEIQATSAALEEDPSNAEVADRLAALLSVAAASAAPMPEPQASPEEIDDVLPDDVPAPPEGLPNASSATPASIPGEDRNTVPPDGSVDPRAKDRELHGDPADVGENTAPPKGSVQ